MSDDDYAILRAGPDHDDYWDCWADFLDDAEIIDGDFVYKLHQDGDLFLVCQELMNPEEYENMFGEEPDESWMSDFAERNGSILYTLPIYWASYLVNGDSSGMEDGESDQVDQFIESEKLGPCEGCYGEPSFRHSNDATNLGGDVCYYIFRK